MKNFSNPEASLKKASDLRPRRLGNRLDSDHGAAVRPRTHDPRHRSLEGGCPHPVSDDPPEVMWDVLAGLDFKSGEVAEELQPFVGQGGQGTGLHGAHWKTTPAEVSEFLLVPYVGACVHTPPPPPNQLVYVTMEEAQAGQSLVLGPGLDLWNARNRRDHQRIRFGEF